MLKKPIELHIYDDNGEVKETYKLCIIPWGMMKKAVSVFDKLSESKNESGDIDEMTGFLCDLFKNRFTPDDLNEHADAKEVMAAISAVSAEIISTNPNAEAEPQKK
ncbi:hypothetical protein CAFE_23460 [Caprobacter fermentans]|uniref:Phage protein n=1 Tax=Caproicibacter fermentans TaxID=2576756 RepID=A0A6N8I0G4_9FIRM|nr:hypothetical protein [Caproicibacter fermentans]MVB11624.1 hypothetical protein [Caproicibacter fermentans]